MGFLSSLGSLFGIGKRQVNVIVVGLDNSGKTTLLNQLRPAEVRTSTIVPTVGSQITHFTTQNFTFNAFDMAGASKYRQVWETYYNSAQAIIFVVDSSDRLRVAVARDELWMILDHRDVANRGIPILLLANKQDEKDALTAAEISNSLGLELIRGREWTIESTCALTGAGLEPAMQWLSSKMKQYIESLNR